jgi:hypothetical protein
MTEELRLPPRAKEPVVLRADDAVQESGVGGFLLLGT